MLDKLDKIWVGLLIGVIVPLFSFFCYWLFFHNEFSFPYGVIRYLRGGNIMQEISMICVAFNLVLFYLILNKKAYGLSKGIMFATFGYVLVILYISLL